MSKAEKIKAAIEAVHTEIDRQQDMRGSSPFDVSNIRLWRSNGSAGAALGWFEEIADANPHAICRQLVVKLRRRIDSEIQRRPGWFSKGHLFGVAQLISDSLGPVSALPVPTEDKDA